MWTKLALIGLGAWLAASPAAFGYQGTAIGVSDLLTGAALIVLSAGSFRRPALNWAIAGLGVWMLLAPLVFWSPSAAAYSIDYLIGALVVLLSVGLRGTESPGPEVPPGWSYNPSSWGQRIPIVGLALAGYLVARILTSFQLGYIASVWDPFFGRGSERVLTSEVSHAWPISDAGLGAFSYMTELLTTCIGGRKRWRTMPWMVVLFGILVVPLGVTHVVLVVLQPMAVGAWCTLCLVVAAIMLAMIPPAVDEVVATVQFLRRARPFWKTFWRGGPSEERPAEPAREPRSVAWSQVAVAAVSVWLLFSPTVFSSRGAAAASDYTTGLLVLTFAVTALSESARVVRFAGVPLGLWIAVSHWVLSGSTPLSAWIASIAGLAIAGLSLPRGPIRKRFGTWDRVVRIDAASLWRRLRLARP